MAEYYFLKSGQKLETTFQSSFVRLNIHQRQGQVCLYHNSESSTQLSRTPKSEGKRFKN